MMISAWRWKMVSREYVQLVWYICCQGKFLSSSAVERISVCLVLVPRHPSENVQSLRARISGALNKRKTGMGQWASGNFDLDRVLWDLMPFA